MNYKSFIIDMNEHKLKRKGIDLIPVLLKHKKLKQTHLKR